MKKTLLVMLLILVPSLICATEDKPTSSAKPEEKDISLYKKFKIDDDVKWLDETPVKPEDYIGQLWVIQKNGDSMPFHTPINLPVQSFDEPTIKKSVLIKSGTDGTVSFLNLLSFKGEKESVYQFQIVDNKKWSANARDAKYVKAISVFRNDPITGNIFEENDFGGVVMCTAIVQKKIWYKNYKKKSWGMSGTYYVTFSGNDYYGSEDYEETVKYGLVLRPLNGFGYKLPKTIVNSEQVEKGTKDIKIPAKVLDKLDLKQLRDEKTQKEAECADDPAKCQEL